MMVHIHWKMDQFPENDCNGKKTMEKDDDTVVLIKNR
jgi:hypothetical protein